MCPACIAGAAVMVSGAISGGGVTALVARLHSKIRRSKVAREKVSSGSAERENRK
jgi:hypothetical protein